MEVRAAANFGLRISSYSFVQLTEILNQARTFDTHGG